MHLSAAQIRYLLAIYELSDNGKVRSNEVAEKMGISRPSVHRMMGQLAERKLITKERYSFAMITESGEKTARKYRDRLGKISVYFVKEMGLKEETAQEVAFALLGGLEETKINEICDTAFLPDSRGPVAIGAEENDEK